MAFTTQLGRYFAVAAATGLIMMGNATSAQAFKRSQSSIMINAETGDVLFASNADEQRYPASLTKLMTLYITFNALDKGLIKMTDKLPVSRTAANRSPSRLGLRPGEKIAVRDAILALITKSANDCATVLAEGLGYSEEKFAVTMTEVARELGMKNTVFKNASGLPNRAQKTTARDMAVLAAAIYHHFPQYYKLFSTRKFTYKGQTFYTHNHLLKTFKGADGMKTGFTNAAGYNIVTSAKRGDNRVIAVTMGHDSVKTRDQRAAGMMTRGLQKLALADNIAPTGSLYAKTEIAPAAPAPLKQAQKPSQTWGVQIGAFSNYVKARNYALTTRKEIKLAAIRKTQVEIEPAQKGSAIVYRSKLVGLQKNEADKTCNQLKKSNKSCIVVATIQSQHLAMADHN